MIAYQEFVALCESGDSEARGYAAHLAAAAFIHHSGPADEQAALYAALMGFLEDASVKVRAALAFGLLHSARAPRPVILALLNDAPIIARAVAQYSAVLVDADLLLVLRDADEAMLDAVVMRQGLSCRVAESVLTLAGRSIMLKLLRRRDVALLPDSLKRLAAGFGDQPDIRGALLDRPDLPAAARLALIGQAAQAIRSLRIVAGAVAPSRLDRIVRNASDAAAVLAAERGGAGASDLVDLVTDGAICPRLLLRALIDGRLTVFARCLAELAEVPAVKVAGALRHGSTRALDALLKHAGLGVAIRGVMIGLVEHARSNELGDDPAARHFAVLALTEDLLAKFGDAMPAELIDTFAYLGDQNIRLAQAAARGVMPAFLAGPSTPATLPAPDLRPPPGEQEADPELALEQAA